MKTYSVYVLTDPVTSNPFYVGMTSKSLAVRAKGHVGEKKVSPSGKPGKIRLLYRTFDLAQASRGERRWIEAVAAHGFTLMNAHAPNPTTPHSLVQRKILGNFMSVVWNLEQALDALRRTWLPNGNEIKSVNWFELFTKELEKASEYKSKRLIRGIAWQDGA